MNNKPPDNTGTGEGRASASVVPTNSHLGPRSSHKPLDVSYYCTQKTLYATHPKKYKKLLTQYGEIRAPIITTATTHICSLSKHTH